MAYFLRSKSTVNSAEHIYATIAPPKKDMTSKKEPIYATPIPHHLAIVNITGNDREDDYELAMNHRVIGSDKSYMKFYKTNDIIVLHMTNTTMMGVIEDMNSSRVEDYLNNGGEISETYLCFRPILEMESAKTTTIRFCVDSGVKIDLLLSRQQLFDKVASCSGFSIPNTQAVYNSWFIENRPGAMKDAHQFVVYFIEACFQLFFRYSKNIWKVSGGRAFKDMCALHMLVFKKSQHRILRIDDTMSHFADNVSFNTYQVACKE